MKSQKKGETNGLLIQGGLKKKAERERTHRVAALALHPPDPILRPQWDMHDRAHVRDAKRGAVFLRRQEG